MGLPFRPVTRVFGYVPLCLWRLFSMTSTSLSCMLLFLLKIKRPMPSRSLKRTGFHLHPLLLHMVLKCFSTQTGRESCHRNVYKSRPEECKQSWVELLSDKRVNFRRSCCDLPVWSFHYTMALWRIILSEWITVLIWPSNWNKNSCLQEESRVTGENWKWREWKSDWFTVKFPVNVFFFFS